MTRAVNKEHYVTRFPARALACCSALFHNVYLYAVYLWNAKADSIAIHFPKYAGMFISL